MPKNNVFVTMWNFLKRAFMRVHKSSVMTMTRVFLKEKQQTSYSMNPVRDRIIKIALRIVFFVAITAALVFVFYFSVMLNILTFANTLLYDSKVMTTIMLFLFAVMLITTTLSLTKDLYFAPDNTMLLTMPVNGSRIFFAKLFANFIWGLDRAVVFVMPSFVAFGIACGCGFSYYVAVLLGTVVLVLLITALAAVLSVPTMFITLLIKRIYVLQVLLFAAFVGVVIFAIYRFVAVIPEDLNIVANFSQYQYGLQRILITIQDAVPFIRSLTLMLVGTTVVKTSILGFPYYTHQDLGGSAFVTMGLCLAIATVCFVVVWFGARYLFNYMASRQYESSRKRTLYKHKNITTPSVISQVKIDLLGYVRDPKRFFGNTIYILLMPWVIYLLNKVFTNIDLSLSGDTLVIAVNVLIIMLMSMAGNAFAASVLSREGDAYIMLKTFPTKMATIFYARLFFISVCSLLSVAATSLVLEHFTDLTSGDLVLLAFGVMFFNFAHLLWTADLGLLNPQQKFYHDGKHATIDPNERQAAVIGFLLAVACFGINLFFIGQMPISDVLLRLFLIGGGLFVARLALSVTRVRTVLRGEA